MAGVIDVLHEDESLLVVNKPAGLVCHPTKGDVYSSLISRARLHVGGPVFLVNRLDRETSGIVVLAKSPEVAGELGKLFESGIVEKHYLAIVHGAVAEDAGVIEAPLGKDVSSVVAIKDCVRADGAAAVTEFRVLRRFERKGREWSLVGVRTRSGRKHQIRIHLAHIGHPLVGDKLYGGDEGVYLRFVTGAMTDADRVRIVLSNQGLHADELAFAWRGHELRFEAKASEEFVNFLGAEFCGITERTDG
jgi:RluA family pseudouridine synthase